jgi:hypothetical protein
MWPKEIVPSDDLRKFCSFVSIWEHLLGHLKRYYCLKNDKIKGHSYLSHGRLSLVFQEGGVRIKSAKVLNK